MGKTSRVKQNIGNISFNFAACQSEHVLVFRRCVRVCGLLSVTGIAERINVRMYYTCVIEHRFRYECMTIIKVSYLIKFGFHKIHFAIQTMAYLHRDVCVVA